MSEETEKQLAKAGVKAISDYVNKFGSDPAHFAEAFRREHRTLQQSMVRLFVASLQALAEDNRRGYVDLRNQAAADFATSIKPTMDDTFFPFA